MKNKNKLPIDDEGHASRNVESLRSFSLYCLDHPEQRFFQALRNWFGVGYIGMSSNREDWQDTFNLEEGRDYEIKK